MQRDYEIEDKVYRLLEAVEKGQQVEDDLTVELKRDWPANHQAAARRIAAQANAAQGKRVLWLIGVDEKGQTITGASFQDPAKWRDQVAKNFDGHWAPGITALTIQHGDVSVIALVIDTEGVPFVVQGKGGILEVPWRGSTQTRSARRSELLKILLPQALAPQIKILKAEMFYRFARSSRGYDPGNHLFELGVDAYFTTLDSRQVVLPYHLMKGGLFTLEGEEIFEFDSFSSSKLPPSRPGKASSSANIISTQSELILNGPGRAIISASGEGEVVDIEQIEEDCQLRLRIVTAPGEREVPLRQKMSGRADGKEGIYWVSVWPESPFLSSSRPL